MRLAWAFWEMVAFWIGSRLETYCSEGQETDAIAPAPENAHKKFEGRGRSRT
jgi:hypothetical protein